MRAKVGDRYVLEELQRDDGWQLGGEGSGHLLALDKHTTGDGIVSALQVLAVRPQRPVARRAARGCRLFPQTLINVGSSRAPTGRNRDAGDERAAVERELGGSGPGADPCVGHRAGAAGDGRGGRRKGRGASTAETIAGARWHAPSVQHFALGGSGLRPASPSGETNVCFHGVTEMSRALRRVSVTALSSLTRCRSHETDPHRAGRRNARRPCRPPRRAQDITGAGATFPAPIYAKWADAYKKATGDRLNYQSIGSGGGIKQITAKTVDFGASDMPLSDDELAKDGLVQFPTVIGGVVPVVNITGVAPGQLKLTGQLLGDIYLGKITKWNDPAITALNPGVKLPDAAISPVHRADGSGTTFIFTNYLSKVNPEWKAKVGEGTAVNWPTGVGGKGNEGVAVVRAAPAELDRLRRVRVRQAEQDDLHAAAEQGRQVRRARRRHLQGRRRRRRLAKSLLPDPDRPAGQGRLADHRRDLHPDAQDAGEARDRTQAR